MRTATPPETSTSAGTSSRARVPWLSGSLRAAPTVAATPIGTLTQKIQCQLSPCVMPPPISGPAATASPAMPPQMPTTAPRFSIGNAEVKIVRLKGITMAAPIPCMARQAMSTFALGASAQAAEAAVKRARPTT